MSQSPQYIHSLPVFGDAPNLKMTGTISSSNFISITLNLIFSYGNTQEILPTSSIKSLHTEYFYQNPLEEEFYQKNGCLFAVSSIFSRTIFLWVSIKTLLPIHLTQSLYLNWASLRSCKIVNVCFSFSRSHDGKYCTSEQHCLLDWV